MASSLCPVDTLASSATGRPRPTLPWSAPRRPQPQSGQKAVFLKITHDTGKLRIAYTTTVPQNFNPEFDLGPEAELTCLANMGSDSWENHRPMPDVVNKNSNSTVVEAYDLFRRLGRLGLQHHYPELGVKDLSSCGPPLRFDDDDGDLAQDPPNRIVVSGLQAPVDWRRTW